MIPQELQTLRKECYKANLELPKLGLVLYTFGNFLVEIPANRAPKTILLMPVIKGNLTAFYGRKAA